MVQLVTWGFRFSGHVDPSTIITIDANRKKRAAYPSRRISIFFNVSSSTELRWDNRTWFAYVATRSDSFARSSPPSPWLALCVYSCVKRSQPLASAYFRTWRALRRSVIYWHVVSFLNLSRAWGWNSGQSSPTSTKDFKKFVVIRVAGDEKHHEAAGLSECPSSSSLSSLIEEHFNSTVDVH